MDESANKSDQQPQPAETGRPESQPAETGRPESQTTTVFIRVGPAGRLPLYATAGSAGCDLFAAVALTLRPGEIRLLPLDLVMAIEPGIEAQIRPRSGLSLRTDLRLPNAPGTVDSDYRSEVGVILQNTFSQADLPARILADPGLAVELAGRCCSVRLADYLRTAAGEDSPQGVENRRPAPMAGRQPTGENQQPMAEKEGKAAWAKAAELLEQALPALADQNLLLDEQGNPYGTLYIQAGDRIAQMVFSRCLQASFIEHPQPETVGQDRRGGFGSTGA